MLKCECYITHIASTLLNSSLKIGLNAKSGSITRSRPEAREVSIFRLPEHRFGQNINGRPWLTGFSFNTGIEPEKKKNAFSSADGKLSYYSSAPGYIHHCLNTSPKLQKHRRHISKSKVQYHAGLEDIRVTDSTSGRKRVYETCEWDSENHRARPWENGELLWYWTYRVIQAGWTWLETQVLRKALAPEH